MPQPENFLNYFQQTGALNQYDPVRSEERATNILGARAGIESSQLNSDMKRLEIGKSVLRQVTNKEDWERAQGWLKNTIGLDRKLFPEKFENDAEFLKWKPNALLSADEMIKMQQGQPFNVYWEDKDGNTVTAPVQSQQDLQNRQNSGQIPETAQFGKVSKFKGAGTDKTKAEKKASAAKLEKIKSNYFTTIGRYYSSKRGVGQYITDPNKEKVAEEAATAADIIAQQYVASGGDIKDLGISETGPAPETPEFPSVVENKGRVIKDTDTGKRYKSDGKNWNEI